MRLLSFSVSLTLLTLSGVVAAANAFADCRCGYTVEGEKNHYFQHAFETDFLHLSTVDSTVGWLPQNWNVTKTVARGKFGKKATLDQVVPNPIRDRTSWTGQGINGGDPGLQIWVKSKPVDEYLMMGEISSLRDDFLYGSFRMNAKLTSEPGTCTAFFFYRNDSQEIDMEFLSRQYNSSSNIVNLINQTPESLRQGFDAAGTPGFRTREIGFAPYEGYHEYRFDWTPNHISFFIDSKQVWNLTHSVPDSPGHVVLNHWSNGDPLWSGGPPQKDAVLTVSYVKMYFNSSEPDNKSGFSKLCPSFDSSKVCKVEDQTTPADPNSSQGGESAFLSPHTNSAARPIHTSSAFALSLMAVAFFLLV